MSADPSSEARAVLLAAMAAVHRNGRVDATPLEGPVRAYARAQREAGVEVVVLLSELKQMLRDTTGSDEPVLRPRVIGWGVAGYYAGTSRA
jgi:hypothetical protein